MRLDWDSGVLWHMLSLTEAGRPLEGVFEQGLLEVGRRTARTKFYVLDTGSLRCVKLMQPWSSILYFLILVPGI